MIKRIYRSKADIENLSRLRTEIPEGIDKFDYRGLVVNKPWGYEYLMFENANVSIWILFLKNLHKTSMHCHPNKKTALIVLSGEVITSTLEGWQNLTTSEAAIIEEGVFHSTKAVEKDGAFIMEVESPPNKKDLVRLKDEYGREKKGYEGESFMSRELAKYEYVTFHSENQKKIGKQILRNCQMEINRQTNKGTKVQIYELFSQAEADMLCLLQGRLHSSTGQIVLSAGEVQHLKKFKQGAELFAFSDIVFLSLLWQQK